MQILIRMIETALGVQHSEGKVTWPQTISMKGEDGNSEEMRKRVYEDVEGLVFGRRSLESVGE